MGVSGYRQISHAALGGFCNELFAAYGFSAAESGQIAEVILRADLYGIESHGVHRLIRYHEEIHNGFVDVGAKSEIVHETPISAVIDAHKAMGQLVSIEAMALAMQKAKVSGIGMSAVRNSNHYGIASYYSEMALREDLAGICMTNTEAICVPTHAKRAMLGTNPIAFAIPALPVPFSFDASTTVVPRGTLEVFKNNGEKLPDSWALDQNGKPCTDAAFVLGNIIGKLGGGIAPLGGAGEKTAGHKGYGLAAMVDIFTGIFSSGLTSNHVNTQTGVAGMCHYFCAFDYGLFGDKAVIRQNLSHFLQELRDTPKADGQSRVYIPGERNLESLTLRQNALIPVSAQTYAELQKIAQEMHIPFNLT
ncbi:MAG: Ldh family oxidoreductase [Treponemataceae bacterium]|nr:MAG: Ldh family oxidoreductase [Treponemataceae bacterium]